MNAPREQSSSGRGCVKWTLIGCAILALCLVATFGLVTFFFGPTILEKARGVADTVGEIMKLQARLQGVYPDERFQVNMRVINGTKILDISLVNSEHAGSTADEKRSLAYDMARLAFDTYPQAGELATIRVTFTKLIEAGPVRTRDDSDRYEFTPAELETAEPAETRAE